MMMIASITRWVYQVNLYKRMKRLESAKKEHEYPRKKKKQSIRGE